MNLPKDDFYVPGEKHVCRFCATPMASIIEGVLKPLANKAHVTMLLKSGTIHRFNCCAHCAKKTKFDEPGLLQAIWDGDCRAWKSLETLQGECAEECEARLQVKLQEQVVADFFVRELSLTDAPKAIKLAKARHAKLQKEDN